MKNVDVIELVESPSFEEAKQKAADIAASTFSLPLLAVMYRQAGRPYFSTAFPVATLVRMVRFESAPKGTAEPEKYTNRPVMADHVRTISEYLEDRVGDQEKYILPGITLNLRERIKVYTFSTPSAMRGAILIVPTNATFYVTDGQHRIRAIQAALGTQTELGNDAISVTIVVEPDLDQVHQDFADCAQVKPIPPSLLTLYDAQDKLSSLTVRITEVVPFFKGRLEKVGKTVSKRSNYLYTLNHVRMSVGAALTGDSSSSAPALRSQVSGMLSTDSEVEEWFGKLKWFYNELSTRIPEWGIVREANIEGKSIPDLAEFRAKYLHFGGTGLAVIGAVGNIIFGLKDLEERDAKLEELSRIDWRRSDEHGVANPLWDGTVLVEGRMVTSRYAVQAAVERVLDLIGLTVEEEPEPVS
jgi:DGQHR domain-containing protein